MKNTLAKQIHKTPPATGIKEAQAMRAALAYAGVAPEHARFDRVLLSGDALGAVYELEFQNLLADASHCGMAYCCYVDAFTGEVRGFMGISERIPPAQPTIS